MPREPITVTVAGKTHRLVATTDPATLARLAEMVDAKLAQIDSRHPDAMLLAALALANDIRALTGDNARLSSRNREILKSLLDRVDRALDYMDENGDPLPSRPAVARPEL